MMGSSCPPPPVFRKEFDLDEVPEDAVLYASALGIADVQVNGYPVSWFTPFRPGWSDYRKRVYHATWDAQRMTRLRPGHNVITATLADGWYAGYLSWGRRRNRYDGETKLLLQLEMTIGGKTRVVGTDATWRVTTDGPLREADMLMGETFDARKQEVLFGRDADFSSWPQAVASAPPRIAVQPYPGEPVETFLRLACPVASSEPKPGCYIFDMGQNMVGVAALSNIREPAGTRVRLRHAEVLNDDGTLYTEALRGARARPTPTLPARRRWRWNRRRSAPQFTFHGFRYVEVTGVSSCPALEDVKATVLHTAMPRAGDIATSSIMLNRLHQNILWGQRGNYLEVPTDCPQRRRAARVDGRRAGVHADGRVQLRCGVVLHEMDDRPVRRAEQRGMVPRRRAVRGP